MVLAALARFVSGGVFRVMRCAIFSLSTIRDFFDPHSNAFDMSDVTSK